MHALSKRYGFEVNAEDLGAYIAAVTANPAYVSRFRKDLVQPGLRVPIAANSTVFNEAVQLGREVIWLHTFGERFASPSEDRPATAPRLPQGQGPFIPKEGAIPSGHDEMPNSISYHATKRRLSIGSGFIDNVSPQVWAYEVSGKPVIQQWFSYRRRDRTRPIIGDRRPPSPLDRIQPDGWLPEYTAELLNVLHVLGRLVALEPRQADLLARICAGPMVTGQMVQAAIAGDKSKPPKKRGSKKAQNSRQAKLLADD